MKAELNNPPPPPPVRKYGTRNPYAAENGFKLISWDCIIKIIFF